MNIYAGNLPSSVTEEDLKNVFGRYGQVNSVKIILDFNTGSSKGFGFVEMSQSEGESAIEALNGAELSGNIIVVNEAYERRNNNRRNYNDRGRDNRNSGYGRERGGYRN